MEFVAIAAEGNQDLPQYWAKGMRRYVDLVEYFEQSAGTVWMWALCDDQEGQVKRVGRWIDKLKDVVVLVVVVLKIVHVG